MIFLWNLSDSKSQVSRALLSIMANLNNVVVWMVSYFQVLQSLYQSLMTVPITPVTIGIIVTFMFHSIFNSLARSRYFSLLLFAY